MTQLVRVDREAIQAAVYRWRALVDAQFDMALRWEDAAFERNQARLRGRAEEEARWARIKHYRRKAMSRLRDYCAQELGRMAIDNPWLVGR